jgi:hypothetical protein
MRRNARSILPYPVAYGRLRTALFTRTSGDAMDHTLGGRRSAVGRGDEK